MRSSSADLLRTARKQARLSQNDLARRAGVVQSVISAYESGSREPSLSTLSRLVEATGHVLAVDVVPVSEYPPGLPETPLGRRLRQRRKAIIRAAEEHHARNVRVFGSVARGEDTDSSDIDLLVDLDEGAGLSDLIGLKRELADLLGVDVDVVPAASLKPRMRARVLHEAVAL